MDCACSITVALSELKTKAADCYFINQNKRPGARVLLSKLIKIRRHPTGRDRITPESCMKINEMGEII